jgi:vacuolar-type H+-ATPase subunit F/Vma7
VGIVIITERAAELIRPQVTAIPQASLIVEVPDA